METLGDAFLTSLERDFEQLDWELLQLELAKRTALAGYVNHSTARAVETRVKKLSRAFEQRRGMFEFIFDGSRGNRHHVDALRKTVQSIASRIVRLLGMGRPDRGRSSIAKIVQKHQTQLKQFKTLAVQPEHDTLDLPGLPRTVQGDPVLAIAILLDLIRLHLWELLTGKGK